MTNFLSTARIPLVHGISMREGFNFFAELEPQSLPSYDNEAAPGGSGADNKTAATKEICKHNSSTLGRSSPSGLWDLVALKLAKKSNSSAVSETTSPVDEHDVENCLQFRSEFCNCLCKQAIILRFRLNCMMEIEGKLTISQPQGDFGLSRWSSNFPVHRYELFPLTACRLGDRVEYGCKDHRLLLRYRDFHSGLDSVKETEEILEASKILLLLRAASDKIAGAPPSKQDTRSLLTYTKRDLEAAEILLSLRGWSWGRKFSHSITEQVNKPQRQFTVALRPKVVSIPKSHISQVNTSDSVEKKKNRDSLGSVKEGKASALAIDGFVLEQSTVLDTLTTHKDKFALDEQKLRTSYAGIHPQHETDPYKSTHFKTRRGASNSRQKRAEKARKCSNISPKSPIQIRVTPDLVARLFDDDLPVYALWEVWYNPGPQTPEDGPQCQPILLPATMTTAGRNSEYLPAYLIPDEPCDSRFNLALLDGSFVPVVPLIDIHSHIMLNYDDYMSYDSILSLNDGSEHQPYFLEAEDLKAIRSYLKDPAEKFGQRWVIESRVRSVWIAMQNAAILNLNENIRYKMRIQSRYSIGIILRPGSSYRLSGRAKNMWISIKKNMYSVDPLLVEQYSLDGIKLALSALENVIVYEMCILRRNLCSKQNESSP